MVKRAALLLSLLAACGDDPTQIIVEIYGADEIINDVTGVRIRVEGRAAEDAFDDPPRYVTDTAIPASAGDFPLTHVIAPLDGDASRIYRVTAQGLVSGATGVDVISEARAMSGFIAGETRVLRLYLPGGPCRERTCAVTQTCVQGSCEEIALIPPELLPRRGDGDPDAGPDGGLDAAIDANTCEGEGTSCPLESLCAEGIIECSTDGEPVCVATGEARAAGSVCREADESGCDAEETCDGESFECPADDSLPDLTECGEDLICVGGACGECVPNDPCDTGNPCERAQLACEMGAPTCEVVGPADPGTVCREAAGLCDVAEVCDGDSTMCPTDDLQPSGMECRASAGPCDLADVCDGASPTCTDSFADATTICNPSQGDCDPAEVCDGVSAGCPSNVLAEPGAECRPGTGECDIGEQCDGVLPGCPDDAFVAFGTMCAGGVCDGAGMCADLGCGDSCNTGFACEIGIIDCSSGAPVCVRERFADSSVVCRPAVDGGCDVAETCSGSDSRCPIDGFASSSVVCRPSAGDCDVPDTCTGMGPSCPGDAKRPSSHVCRAAASGGCDIPESCDGTSNDCPADSFQPTSFVCRLALPSNLCDITETCPGDSAMCPNDEVRPNGEVCRGVGGLCDVAETCDGSSKQCPTNQYLASGTTCRDVAGLCDVAESCTGSGPTCPMNGFLPRDTECRAATGEDCDASEVCAGGTASCPPPSSATCDDLVISEVLPDDSFSLGFKEGFVEIYNTADERVELRSCEVTNNFGSSTDLNVAVQTTVEPGGFFLVAYDSTIPSPDVFTNSAHPTNTDGEVLLLCEGSLVDACGWGIDVFGDAGMGLDSGMDSGPGGEGDAGMGVFSEGPPLMPPPGGRSFERKACADSTPMDMNTGRHRVGGNSEDTDRNADDFNVRTVPQPQSTGVAGEVPAMCTADPG